MRQAEQLERECMAFEQAEMHAIVADEKRIAEHKAKVKKRRAPALRRLEELKELQLEREREKIRLEAEEAAKKKAEVDRLAAEQAKKDHFKAEMKRLDEASIYTAGSQVEQNTVAKKQGTAAAGS
jgi:hypothetical protein